MRVLVSNYRRRCVLAVADRAAGVVVAVCVLLGAGAMPAVAANRYVRAGATGANNGSDWNNAYTQLPATLVRGDTYYIADGTYPGYTFTTPASGTNFIYIKKATIADHGTDVGWQDSYGDGQAVFGPMAHNVANGGYIDLNGYSPHVPGGHGFKIDFDKMQTAFDFQSGGKEFKFRYIDFDGVASSGDVDFGGPPWTYTIKVLPWNGSSYDDTSGMLISHCKLHGSATHIQDNSGNANIVIEYSEFYDCRSIGVDHGNIYWIGSSGGTFRYNKVYNYNVEGLLFGLNNSNWKVYGNIFYDGVSVARGIELYGGRTHTGTKIYNNTFVNMPLASVRVESDAVCSGVEIRNNLSYNSGGVSLENGGAGVTVSANLAAGASNFLNLSGKDFHLARATAPGTVLPAPYNVDFDGRIRGQDGVWDVGAFEFVAGSLTNPVISVAPSSLNFGQVTLGQTNDMTLTVRNVGGGTLQGTATVPLPFSIVSGGSYSLGSNQSQLVTVRYRPTSVGTHSQTITFTGGGGASVPVSGAALLALPGLTFDAVSGLISSPFTTNGGYVSQSVDTGVADGGRAVFAFNITNAGYFTILATVDAPDTSANSFFVNVDGDPTDPAMIWDILPLTSGFEDRYVSWRGNGTFDSPEFPKKTFFLSAGSHQLVIIGREPNTRLLRISITPVVPPPTNLRALLN